LDWAFVRKKGRMNIRFWKGTTIPFIWVTESRDITEGIEKGVMARQ